jgi:hypothetical protein
MFNSQYSLAYVRFLQLLAGIVIILLYPGIIGLTWYHSYVSKAPRELTKQEKTLISYVNTLEEMNLSYMEGNIIRLN